MSWWRRWFSLGTVDDPTNGLPRSTHPDLREFVYLDEVSLLSLLSSQKGEVTESTSEEQASGREAEMSGAAGVNPGFLAKAEATSRYQTNNSSTIQTSRKATAQSRFRELYGLGHLREMEPHHHVVRLAELEELLGDDAEAFVTAASDLTRGKLVELRVQLAADPIFHVGTMVSEFTAMADDYPDMFAAGGGTATLADMQPINRILQRLLAGLVPIRAKALDHVVVDYRGCDYVVHKDLIAGLAVPSRPLEIVGVTNQEAYWKDLRRVLFSDGEFTIYARVARSGLHATWTPVKLAHLFASVAPNLVDQISAASRLPFVRNGTGATTPRGEAALRAALIEYCRSLEAEAQRSLSTEQRVIITARIEELKSRHGTVTDQRSAFASVKDMMKSALGDTVDGPRDLEMRTRARQNAGLSMFPAAIQPQPSAPRPVLEPAEPAPWLLDVEFVAIYW